MGNLTRDLRSRAERSEREADRLKDEKSQLESELQRLRNNLDAKEKEARDLQSDLWRMTTRANNAESQVLSLKATQGAAPVPKVGVDGR